MTTAYYAEIAAETEARRRRLAIRQQEQERLHAQAPHRVPRYIPVDDPELPDESFTAGWSPEPGA